MGVEETSVQDLISPPAGAHLITGVADVGGFTHNGLSTPSVMSTNPVLTTGTSLDYSELAPSFILRVGYGNGGGQNIGFSTDGGGSWSPASSAPGGASGGTVAAAADGSRVLWSPSGKGVFFTTDRGSSWTASSGVPAGTHGWPQTELIRRSSTHLRTRPSTSAPMEAQRPWPLQRLCPQALIPHI